MTTETKRRTMVVRTEANSKAADPILEARRAEFRAHAEDCAAKLEGRTEAALFDYTVGYLEDTVRGILAEIDPTDPAFLRSLFPELLLWKFVKDRTQSKEA